MVLSIQVMDFYVFEVAEVSAKPLFPSFQNLSLTWEGNLKQELHLHSS